MLADTCLQTLLTTGLSSAWSCLLARQGLHDSSRSVAHLCKPPLHAAGATALNTNLCKPPLHVQAATAQDAAHCGCCSTDVLLSVLLACCCRRSVSRRVCGCILRRHMPFGE